MRAWRAVSAFRGEASVANPFGKLGAQSDHIEFASVRAFFT